MADAPTPFDAQRVMKLNNLKGEADDSLIPPGGFVSDFVLGTRDIPAPTLFCIWQGLFLVSSVMKRLAYYRWGKSILVPNLYVVACSEPAIAKKTTLMQAGLRVLNELFNDNAREPIITDEELLFLRAPRTKLGAITPEALHEHLMPKMRTIKSLRRKISSGSTMNLVLSELTGTFDKKLYNTGLITKMVSLYDSADIGEDRTTIQKNTQKLENIYVTLWGNTNPREFRNSFPEQAFDGGFPSRTVFVYTDKMPRLYVIPPILKDAPTNTDLANRLGWIAQTALGEYHLSKEAFKLHAKWYNNWMPSFVQSSEFEKSLFGRLDTIILKMALLMRAQRYEPGTEISVDDYNAAHALIDATAKTSRQMFRTIFEDSRTDPAKNSPTDYIEGRVIAHMKRKDPISRKRLRGNVRNLMSNEEFTDAIRQLFAERKIFGITGVKVNYDIPSEKSEEVYYTFPEDIDEDNLTEELLQYARMAS